MAGLVPAIPAGGVRRSRAEKTARNGVDGRDKHGHDDLGCSIQPHRIRL